MEIFKNMEVVLCMCFAVVCAGACLVSPGAPAPRYIMPDQAQSPSAAPAPPMQVVVVSARRMTAAEKATSAQPQSRPQPEPDSRSAG